MLENNPARKQPPSGSDFTESDWVSPAALDTLWLYRLPLPAPKESTMQIRSVVVVAGLGLASYAHGHQAVQWRGEDGGNGHWYQVIEFPHTMSSRSEVVGTIGALGGYPAVFEAASEWLAFRTLAPQLLDAGNAHIGLFRDPYSEWTAFDGGAIAFTAWGPNLPNNYLSEAVAAAAHPGSGSCGQVNGCWEDYGPHETGWRQWVVEWSADCNDDGIVDYGQCRDGSLPDYNVNNVPDCCEAGIPCTVGNYPVQWRVEDGGNGHWYRRTEQPGTWYEAAARAEAVGGVLASVTSNGENEVVRSLIGPTQACWIGARKLPGIQWEWLDGSAWGFTMWCPGEPCCGDPERNIFLNDSGCWNDNGGLWIASGFIVEWSADCNGDGIVDYGQILDDTFTDTDENGVPDPCEIDPCPGDITGGGQVNGVDLAAILGAWGTDGQGKLDCDINEDGTVDAQDLSIVLAGWGKCP
jgi:hypothetical protein